jgi:hypothetical protein
VRADGGNLIGHAGMVLLRKVADRVDLATALSAALPKGTGPGWRDRGMALVQLACTIVLGATNALEAEPPPRPEMVESSLTPNRVSQPIGRCVRPTQPRPQQLACRRM